MQCKESLLSAVPGGTCRGTDLGPDQQSEKKSEPLPSSPFQATRTPFISRIEETRSGVLRARHHSTYDIPGVLSIRRILSTHQVATLIKFTEIAVCLSAPTLI
eukprot:TRINITY_DN1277_c0_g1_i2.p3 TRINITY_DN1277_c0_g1~~TRINITY_DN1277_c0_g1_i2.p3  ORF type:complete len:103 (+),score=6.11 TRINITY_DN1277_c0_g1_i2:1468-1776(+)